MTKRISPSAIGIFVVGSFVLVIAAIIAVGAGNFFSKPERFVCLFQGDVNGLKIGAPVKFRGVQIGTVEQIKLLLAPGEGEVRPDIKELRLPVIIGIDRELVTKRGGTGQAFSKTGFEAMISRGLSAQLNAESLLTGLLYIDLDLHPNSQPKFALVPGSSDMREIPTIPTVMEALQKHATEAIAKLDSIDFNALVASITQTVDSIKVLTTDPAVKATLASLPQTVANLDKALTSIRAVTENVNQEIDPAMASFRESSEEANATMKDTRAALIQLEATLDADSPLAVNLNQALEQFADTTQALEELTNYLQRNPGSLVRGRYVPEKDR